MGDGRAVERGFDLGQGVWRDRGQEAAARLRVVGERRELGRDAVADRQRGGHEPAVMGSAAGLDAGQRELEGAVERAASPPPRRRSGSPDAAGHLQAVTEEAEAGDVGRGPDTGATRTSDAARLSVRIWSIAAAKSSRLVSALARGR